MDGLWLRYSALAFLGAAFFLVFTTAFLRLM